VINESENDPNRKISSDLKLASLEYCSGCRMVVSIEHEVKGVQFLVTSSLGTFFEQGIAPHCVDAAIKAAWTLKKCDYLSEAFSRGLLLGGAMSSIGLIEKLLEDDRLIDAVNVCIFAWWVTFINKGTNKRWVGVLTDAQVAAYEKAAEKKLGKTCAGWLATGGKLPEEDEMNGKCVVM